MAPPDCLHALLKAGREVLVLRWVEAINATIAPGALPRAELVDRVPEFVDEVVQALDPDSADAHQPGAPSVVAIEHGAQRLRLGFNVAQVVREYGLVHDCVLRLAEEGHLALSYREQQTLATWINAGIADAIAEYVNQRDAELERQSSEHLGFLAHELRNPISAATLAAQRLRRQTTASLGPTVDLLERNLHRTEGLIDNTLSQAVVGLGTPPSLTRTAIRPLLEEIVRDAALEASARRIEAVIEADPSLNARADPKLLRSAVGNLYYNALKFSREDSTIVLRAGANEGKISISVQDACGGLPPGKIEELFDPAVQRGTDRSGFGFGLTIARRAVEAQHGSLMARDVPAVGCVFTVELPQA